MIQYSFEGKNYKIVITDEWDRNEQRAEQILRDFKYCESIFDWGTIKNRIKNGTHLGWLIEIGENEIIEPPTNDKGFW